MRRRALWATVSVQSGRRASFLRRVARAFTDHSIRGDHSWGNASDNMAPPDNRWGHVSPNFLLGRCDYVFYGVNVEQTSTVLAAS